MMRVRVRHDEGEDQSRQGLSRARVRQYEDQTRVSQGKD
jgi:hypothetical protein